MYNRVTSVSINRCRYSEVPLESLRVPAWVRDAVFYQIFPDRFAQSVRVAKPANLEDWNAPPTFHGFKGGDLFGIVERLDYLVELGINAIYCTPIFQSTANHRYHTHDYFRVDPLLGGDVALRALLAAAHGRGMKVVLDGVFNHASRGFFQFNHLLENGKQSPYLDWFHVRSWPLFAYEPTTQPAGYAAWWGLKALPEFNTDTPAVREFLFAVARYWIEFGIDGWRLDVPNEIDDDDFWQQFRRVVKAANPEAYIVGEIWDAADRWLQGDQFDAVMNYQFTRACLEFFAGARGDPDLMRNGYGTPQPCDAPTFARNIETLLRRYAPAATGVMLNPLGSHDTPRFLSMARGDESALRLALLMQMAYPGAPCIFYGDEIGMVGGKDPDMRPGMIWDESQWNISLRDYVKRCIALRRAHPSLRWGAFANWYAEDMVYAFARRGGGDLCVIILNASDTMQTVTLPTNDWLRDGDVLRDVSPQGGLSPQGELWSAQTWAVANRTIHAVQVAARTGIVLERIDDSQKREA